MKEKVVKKLLENSCTNIISLLLIQFNEYKQIEVSRRIWILSCRVSPA